MGTGILVNREILERREKWNGHKEAQKARKRGAGSTAAKNARNVKMGPGRSEKRG